jgi:FtsH-binding integral membrane protein
MQNSNYPTNQQSPFEYSSASVPVAQTSANERIEFIRKTYVLFLASILFCLVAGAVTLRVPALFGLSASIHPILGIVLLVGLSLGAQAVSRIEGINYVALFGFTSFMGWWFTPMLAAFEMVQPGILTQAASLTAINFGALTAYAFISKKDFSFMGGILFVGLVGIVLGGLANAFLFHSPAASYLISWFTLLLFSGYVLYDTSEIMRRYDTRSYCSAALSLFMDFFNMFLAILNILGGGRR